VGAPPASEVGPAWEDLGLSSEVLELVRKEGYTAPTPVQGQAIPALLAGRDLIVSAQTGTGKTAAFVLPLVEKLKGRSGTLGLILAPSREIALQTQAVMEVFGTPLGVRSVALIGGIDLKIDAEALRTYPQVIVATPGRLCDHADRGNVWLEYLEFLILDEADRMLDMGFSAQLNRILEETPKSRQSLLFSATFPPPVEKLANAMLTDPQRIQIGKSVSAATTVEQRFLFMPEKAKLNQLQRLLEREEGTVFIFTRSKDGASRLWRSLRGRGFENVTQLHSDLRQADREQALEDFKNGVYRIMIATDVIGRGIHVEGVAHVVNYDLPRDAEDYVHRVGRTGRAKARGRATSFITPGDYFTLAKIERLLGRRIRPRG